MDKNEFYNRIKGVAESNGMTCELREDYRDKGTYTIAVSFKFKIIADYIVHQRTIMRHIKPLKNGKVNFWKETIHDGHHHISGPGYYSWPDYDHVFKDKELNSIFDNFVKEIEKDANYYQPIQ